MTDAFDAEEQVRHALRVPEAMPDAVWTRLERALHAEAAAPRDAVIAEVLPIRRRRPLLTGLGIAAAAVVAVAVIAPNVGRDQGPDVVTAAAPPTVPESVQASDTESVAVAAAPPAAPSADPMPASPAPKLAAPMSAASLPARQVLASGIDYDPATMQSSVMKLVDTVGASRTRLMSSVQQDPDMTEGESGFTASADALAGCLQALTASSSRQALVVDRARFLGQDVGIVVAPTGAAANDPMTPFSELEVWVVQPDCTAVQASVLLHEVLTLSPLTP